MHANAINFKNQYADIAAWLETSQFDFAASLRASLIRYGSLTVKQIDAARRCMERANAPKPAAAACDAGAIETAFNTARAGGLKRPKLHIGGYLFSPAPATGRNPGALYVKDDDTGAYLGKIVGGAFHRGYDCQAVQADEIVKVAADPHAAAVGHGKLTGACAVCNRTLSDPESVARGIGPICAARFGW